jgi:hypothetical protein
MCFLTEINTDAKRVDNDNIRIDDNGKIVIENVSNNLGNEKGINIKRKFS